MTTLHAQTITAVEPIAFKPDFSPKNGWMHYGLAILILLIIMLLLAKKHTRKLPERASCQLIEKKHLGNKTVLYIVEYQQQRFLLADNQQALAIHPLQQGGKDESV